MREVLGVDEERESKRRKTDGGEDEGLLEIEEFKEDDDIIRIRGVIYVERNSQKGIIIGQKGEALKKVGTWAREEMERFFQKKVFLELFVKVNENWRTDAKALSRFGYQ